MAYQSSRRRSVLADMKQDLVDQWCYAVSKYEDVALMECSFLLKVQQQVWGVLGAVCCVVDCFDTPLTHVTQITD